MAQQVEQGAGPIGFEAIAEAGDGQKAYTVTFTPSESEDVKKPITSDDDQPGYRTFTDGAEGSIPTGSEEIKLLEKAGTPSLEEKVRLHNFHVAAYHVAICELDFEAEVVVFNLYSTIIRACCW